MKTLKNILTQGRVATIIIVAIILIDQAIKISIKSNMYLGEYIHITDWFYIDFVENNGMAYGMTFINKLALSLFRIVAISALIYYMYKVVAEKNHRWGYVVCLSMIVAGAVGNLIDCLFYGMIFSQSTPFDVAELVTWGEGYAPMLYGKVVDMFYFPLIETTLPQWIPIWGGDDYIFFSPVFNFADSSISVGIVSLVIFFRRELEGANNTFWRGTRWEKKEQE